MGAPANSVWLPPLLMLMVMALAQLAIGQNNDTTSTSSSSSSSPSSVSSSSSTTLRPSSNADLVIGGDLNKAARVEQMDKDLETDLDTNTVTPKSADDGHYDLIDVMAATSAGVGKPKSGQTTRIYTTGDVNDDFWLKHLGDDFKHAIHLQVGGTNEDYNRIINQTSNGIHEEVHHEYLPGAERPPEVQRQEQQRQQQQLGRSAGYGHPNLVTQLSLDGEAMSLKNNYLRQQAEQQQQYARGYALPSMHYSTHTGHAHTYARTQPHTHSHSHSHTHTHSTQHTQHTHAQSGKAQSGLRHRYKSNSGNAAASESPAPSYINSSEDTLDAAQSQAAPSSSVVRSEDLDSQLPFKSAFNDFGSRPTRDLTYLLYKRGL
ncbi:lateral signaling target protein 2 homolog [Drosophila hydei]|uniref:Lateral signaling target protein 2 homolog n=1 Tax=Drosophila hydei TaxID=7224 RepID=A0A6J1LZE9_DROHY|nr:lateral signaling target protein 2 homolog [Drosophila hydei]